jgi:hypothetical protein
LSFAGKEVKVEIMSSEISQYHKDKYPMFSFISGIGGGQPESKRNY